MNNESKSNNLNAGRSAKRLADAAKRIGSSKLVTPHALCAADTATTSLAKAAKHPIVTDISDERGFGDGVWIYLADGWTCRNSDTGSIHEDTIAEALACLKRARYVAENTDEAQLAASKARKAEAALKAEAEASAALAGADKPAGVSPTQQAVEAFVAAFVAFKVSTPDNRAAADAALDAAIVGYRKAHRWSDAMGFLDCVNHYNATYASAQQ